MKRKITRKHLDELAQELQTLSPEEQERYYGGGDGSYASPYTYDEYQMHYSSGSFFGGFVSVGGQVEYYDAGTAWDAPDGGPGGRVVVDVTRSYYGSNSTGSHFLATAYDSKGNIVAQLSGYFLEPRYDPSRSTVAGSDTAIPNGSYVVRPSTFRGSPGYYEVSGVPGRSGVKIHLGNEHKDTEGCPLPGSGIFQQGGDYRVRQSKVTQDQLFSMFGKYGAGGIVMNIRATK